jgi:hypothetical protein
MGDFATPGDRQRDRLSPFTRALHALSRQRHLVTAAGVFLLIVAAWCSWRPPPGPQSIADEDGFAELNEFDEQASGATDRQPAFGAPFHPSGHLQWGQPELPPSPADLPSLGFADESPTTFAPTNSAPAWLLGTIEPDEEPPLPAWNSSPNGLRYSRNANNAEPTTLR